MPNISGLNPIIVTPSGGTNSIVNGGTLIHFVNGGTLPLPVFPVHFAVPTQVAGLVPLYPCTDPDCRPSEQSACYITPVFGNLISGTPESVASYKNDFNTFLLDYPSTLYTAEFVIQRNTNYWFDKINEWLWVDVETVTGNTSGIYYPKGSVPNHPTYTGYAVNWGKVLKNYGTGFYRIKVNTKGKNTGAFTQATGTLSYGSFSGSVAGNVKIGSYTYTYATSGTAAQNWTFVASIINASQTLTGYSATALAGGITITGSNGSSDNGTVISIHINPDNDVASSLAGGTGIVYASTCALISEPFKLMPFICDLADHTIKFEAWLTGKIGSVDTDGSIFDLCGVLWYDSIRARGFFGYKKFVYDEVMLEYGIQAGKSFGLMERVRDKAIKKFAYHSYYHPQWFHNRLAVYGLMSDKCFVSDYNTNNSDYFISRMNVIKAGGYEPEYLDANPFNRVERWQQRRGMVKIDFVSGIQSIIKNVCCSTARTNGRFANLSGGSYNSDFDNSFDNGE